MKGKCYFCQQEMETNKVATATYVGCCSYCPEVTVTTFRLEPDLETLAVWGAAIFFGDKGKEYEAIYYPPDAFYINELRYSSGPARGRVMQLSFCPKNITPHNIKQKFPTLKVWS